jgi:hypothetical protein
VARFQDPSGVRNFETLEDMRIERKRGIQHRSVEHQIPVTLYVKRGQSLIGGFNDGCIFTIDVGALGSSGTLGKLVIVRMRRTHVDATWPLNNDAHKTSEGHNSQSRARI